MKKAMMVLAVLALVVSGVFAANTTLELTTTVAGKSVFGISGTDQTTAISADKLAGILSTGISPWAGGTKAWDVAAVDTSAKAYVGYVTNKKYASAVTMAVTIAPFVNSDASISDKIGYTVTVGTGTGAPSATVTTTSAATPAYQFSMLNTTNAGLRAEQVELTFSAPTGVAAAAAGTYSANVTVAFATL